MRRQFVQVSLTLVSFSNKVAVRIPFLGIILTSNVFTKFWEILTPDMLDVKVPENFWIKCPFVNIYPYICIYPFSVSQNDSATTKISF